MKNAGEDPSGMRVSELVFLRQRTIKRVFMVQTATGRGTRAGDGIYAELWLVVW